jgi:hypothetical protein
MWPHCRWLLKVLKRRRCRQSSARLLRLRTAALSTTGLALRLAPLVSPGSAMPPRHWSLPRVATSALGAERLLVPLELSSAMTQPSRYEDQPLDECMRSACGIGITGCVAIVLGPIYYCDSPIPIRYRLASDLVCDTIRFTACTTAFIVNFHLVRPHFSSFFPPKTAL